MHRLCPHTLYHPLCHPPCPCSLLTDPLLDSSLPAPRWVCSPPLNQLCCLGQGPCFTQEISYSLDTASTYVGHTVHSLVESSTFSSCMFLGCRRILHRSWASSPHPAPSNEGRREPPQSPLTLKGSLVLSLRKSPAFDHLPPHPLLPPTLLNLRVCRACLLPPLQTHLLALLFLEIWTLVLVTPECFKPPNDHKNVSLLAAR